MIEMELAAGEAALVGPYTLRVLAVRRGKVVFALDGPGHEPTAAGPDGADRPERKAVPARSPASRPGTGRRSR
jgi:hypothetical protein